MVRALRVAAVPLEFRDAPHGEAARERLLAAAVGVSAERPRLIALPALTGLLPLAAVAGEPPRWDPRLRRLIARHGEALEEMLAEWAAELARTLNVYLCAGTVLVPVASGVQHVALCFGPDGRLVARQAQLHVRPEEAEAGLTGGDEIVTFEVDGWRAALVVGEDGWVPEVARILSLQGVRLVIHPSFHFQPCSRWRVIAGPWQLVQQSQIDWLHVAPGGELGGRALAARAALFAPCEITPEGRGWLADDDSGRPVVVELDPQALADIRERYPLDRFLNPGLYLRELAAAYREALEPSGAGDRGHACGAGAAGGATA